MKNHFKIFSTSLIVACSLTSSQASYGMEDSNNNNNSNNNLTVKPTSSQASYGIRDDNNNNQQTATSVPSLSELPELPVRKILAMIVCQQAIDDGKISENIYSTWLFRVILAQDKKKFNENQNNNEDNTRHTFLQGLKVYYNITTREQIEVFDKFYNGKLIYKPHEDSDEGKIELPIAVLANPLEGTFDLSKCGNTSQDLSISMGYRKGGKLENVDKVEIWLTPRFLIEKELTTTAAYFQGIMESWDGHAAPVGLFWNWGGWNDLTVYGYLTTQKLVDFSTENLEQKWVRRQTYRTYYSVQDGGREPPRGPSRALQFISFYVHFVN